MSETKHTPGPWCVDETKALGAYGVWTDYPTHPGHDGAGYGSQICSVITQGYSLTGDNRGERDANAHLIAAAPDLLAACEKAMLACQDNLKEYQYKNEPALMEAFEACKAAISRASP